MLTEAERRAKRAEAAREWRRQNPEASRAASRRRDEAVRNDPDRLARQRSTRRAIARRNRENDPEKVKGYQRASYVRTTYGIEVEDYDRMVTEQGGRCGICRTDSPGRGKRYWSIDHNHDTGAVRGLLCSTCNRGLGLLGDDPATLRAAVAYLERTGS